MGNFSLVLHKWCLLVKNMQWRGPDIVPVRYRLVENLSFCSIREVRPIKYWLFHSKRDHATMLQTSSLTRTNYFKNSTTFNDCEESSIDSQFSIIILTLCHILDLHLCMLLTFCKLSRNRCNKVNRHVIHTSS